MGLKKTTSDHGLRLQISINSFHPSPPNATHYPRTLRVLQALPDSRSVPNDQSRTLQSSAARDTHLNCYHRNCSRTQACTFVSISTPKGCEINHLYCRGQCPHATSIIFQLPRTAREPVAQAHEWHELSRVPRGCTQSCSPSRELTPSHPPFYILHGRRCVRALGTETSSGEHHSTSHEIVPDFIFTGDGSLYPEARR